MKSETAANQVLKRFSRQIRREDAAYRAETALAQLAREKIKCLDEARSLIRQLFRTEVDLIPDQQNKTLTVRLHPMTTQAHDEVVCHICTEITATETVFTGSDLRLIYEISSSC
jgi:ribosome recycling factor